MAQWTPWGLGPRTAELPELSRRSGVHIIAATGMHQAKHYDRAELERVYEEGSRNTPETCLRPSAVVI